MGSLPKPNQTVTVSIYFAIRTAICSPRKLMPNDQRVKAGLSDVQTQHSLKELKVICTQIVEAGLGNRTDLRQTASV